MRNAKGSRAEDRLIQFLIGLNEGFTNESFASNKSSFLYDNATRERCSIA